MKANYQTPDRFQKKHKLVIRVAPGDQVHVTTFADHQGHICVSFEGYSDLVARELVGQLIWLRTDAAISAMAPNGDAVR